MRMTNSMRNKRHGEYGEGIGTLECDQGLVCSPATVQRSLERGLKYSICVFVSLGFMRLGDTVDVDSAKNTK